MRMLLLGAAVLGALITVSAPPAYAKRCSFYPVIATGHVRGTYGIARASARNAWRSLTRDLYGWQWNSWSMSEDQRLDCWAPRERRRQCEAYARPCTIW